MSPKGDDDFTTTARGVPHCVSFLRPWEATAEEVLRAYPPPSPAGPLFAFLFPLFVSLWQWLDHWPRGIPQSVNEWKTRTHSIVGWWTGGSIR